MDKKTNEELFKQALIDGINMRIDRELAACEEEVVFSRRHMRAMRRILKGKEPLKPISKKMVVILVAAAVLLLASCAIIYRDQIRDFITDVKECFVEIKFSEGADESKYIEEVYELTYVPDGYQLDNSNIGRTTVQYVFTNSKEEKIKFIQQTLDASFFTVDIEHDYDKFTNVNDYEIYYRHTNGTYYYIWNDGKYAMKLISSEELSIKVLELIFFGIIIK
jgi:hypothetical protein